MKTAKLKSEQLLMFTIMPLTLPSPQRGEGEIRFMSFSINSSPHRGEDKGEGVIESINQDILYMQSSIM
ncbi:MAG: hypothetical protein HY887_08285 [Deltaproteobacteria bacterium]|nr:hypothetical protein [Deltaproteobacteria bacterium]